MNPYPQEDSYLSRELAEIPDEPLLPIEKKLILWSLGLGLGLLGALYWLSQLFPPEKLMQ